MKTVLATILVLASLGANAGEHFSLSGFYIDGAVQYTDLRFGTWKEIESPSYGVPYLQQGDKYYQNVISNRNPIGQIIIGYDFKLFRHLDAYIEVGHRSSLKTNQDKGHEFGSVGIRIRPFAR